MNEREWVESFASTMRSPLGRRYPVETAKKLSYCAQILEYTGVKANDPCFESYQTDLLVSENLGGSRWIPRVVLECKLGSITTHDALTYSAKAATHKHVHPYLRYGILIGEREHYAIPGRLVRHGAHFDFMATWQEAKPSKAEWKALIDLLRQEIAASKTMQTLLATSRSSKRTKYSILHRPLILSCAE